MYTNFEELEDSINHKEYYTESDLGNATNQIIQLANSLKISSTVLNNIPDSTPSFTTLVKFSNGTSIDASGNIVITTTPTLPSHATTISYVKSYVNPGSSVMNSILGQSIQTIILDMINYSTSSIVSGCIADGALPIQDTISSFAGGWKYCNNSSTYPTIVNPATGISNKINWYIFSNTASNLFYKYSRFNTAFIRIQFNVSESTQNGNIPFLTIYTLPQSSGNYASWYRSKKTYTNPSTTPIINQDLVLYVGNDPRSCGFTNLNSSQFINLSYDPTNYQTYLGPSGQTDISSNEIIEYISWGTNSASSVGNVNFTCTQIGYSIGSELKRIVTYF